jgi:Subtilase family
MQIVSFFTDLSPSKFYPPDGFDENKPQSYGVLTQAGISLPEIEFPERKRVYCMAITNDNVSGSTASAWSAAIDQAAAGCMEGENANDENRNRRLFVVSAGNVPPETNFLARRPQDDYPIEDPAQAWNALTIGGYTDLINIDDQGYEDWTPLVDAGALSPHSRTGVTWLQGVAPFKPELVMEAGNRAVNAARTEILTLGSLSLLTTGHEVATPLVLFDGTSAATAQAARLAARLSAAHPDYWPETIRALMVHSAGWTEPMQAAIAATATKRDRYALIRRFGYGLPDFDRANASALNHLALVAQAEIQPFRLEGQRKFNECHYYTLPIPADMLERLENEQVELKITLSYFVDPNPGLSANVDAQRYQSYGLRFDLQRRNETLAQFKARVNAAEETAQGRAAPADGRWMLGQDSISAGSLHCDVWIGPAIELLQRNTICVKPVNGWWRYRASREECNRRTRYALIVAMKTANVDLDIYTPISTGVSVPVEVETRV